MDKMNKENPEDLKKPENLPAPESPAKPRKEKKEKTKMEKLQADNVQLPILVELTYSISVLLLIFVGLAVMIVSFRTGASLLHILLRTSTAMLAMGSLFVLIFYQVSSGALQASLAEQEEAQMAQTQEAQISDAPANLELQNVTEA
jgi:hypothetical protein